MSLQYSHTMPTVLTENNAHKSYFTALPRKEKIRTTLPNVDKLINHLGRYVRQAKHDFQQYSHRPPLILHLQSNPALDTILVKKSAHVYFSPLSVGCRPIGRPTYRSTVDRLSADSRPTVDRPIGRQSTDCLPTVDRQSVDLSADSRPTVE